MIESIKYVEERRENSEKMIVLNIHDDFCPSLIDIFHCDMIAVKWKIRQNDIQETSIHAIERVSENQLLSHKVKYWTKWKSLFYIFDYIENNLI
jgi:hypothetical protein